tara:strand:+ start:18 stop:254 length:237 start_codon:yes stop_codon:yes gene_type:complete
MVKDFYFVRKQGYDKLEHREIWNRSNALIVVETSESKAKELAVKMGHWNPKDTLTCSKLDIKKYKIGDVVIHDFGDDG